MTRQKTCALSRLRRAIHAYMPLRGTQNLCHLMIVFCLLSSAHAAEGTRPAYAPPPPAVSSGSIVQIIFSLLLVLAAIVLVAWLLRRMNVAQHGSGNLLRVVGGVAIGQRERIVLVEVEDTWLVVGVGPGQIRTLHTLQKTEDITSDLAVVSGQPGRMASSSIRGQKSEGSSPEHLPSGNKFSRLLSLALGHRNQGAESK